MGNLDMTDVFDKDGFSREYIHIVLKEVIEVIEAKGYNPVNQIMGYIKTDNPVYIPRDNGARDKIIKIKNDDILEYLLYFFIKEN